MQILLNGLSVSDIAGRFCVDADTVKEWLEDFHTIIGTDLREVADPEPPGTVVINSCDCTAGTLTVNGNVSPGTDENFTGLHVIVRPRTSPAPSAPTGAPTHPGGFGSINLPVGPGEHTVYIWGVFEKTTQNITPGGHCDFDCDGM